MCVGILLWFDVCWRYGVVRLGWCGNLMQAEALVLYLFFLVLPVHFIYTLIVITDLFILVFILVL